MHDIGNGLGISCRAGPTAPDGVVDLCEFVRHSVRDVGAGRGSRIGAYGIHEDISYCYSC